MGAWKETASGAKDDRKERKGVLALAQARKIDAILVTELTRWGRSLLDLVHTLQELQAWGVSLIAQTGLQFDMATPQGKLIAALMAALAEFERDLLRERVRSGIAAAKSRGFGTVTAPVSIRSNGIWTMRKWCSGERDSAISHTADRGVESWPARGLGNVLELMP